MSRPALGSNGIQKILQLSKAAAGMTVQVVALSSRDGGGGGVTAECGLLGRAWLIPSWKRTGRLQGWSWPVLAKSWQRHGPAQGVPLSAAVPPNMSQANHSLGSQGIVPMCGLARSTQYPS